MTGITEDAAVDIGEKAMREHADFIQPNYGDKLTRAYLCGCLAVITHWLIKNCGPERAFEILTEMADCAISEKLPKGK